MFQRWLYLTGNLNEMIGRKPLWFIYRLERADHDLIAVVKI